MFVFPNTLSISNVNEVRDGLEIFLEEMEPGSEIVFDVSGLQDLDTAGLQLILSACRTFYAEDRSFSFNNISPLVQHLFQISGVMDIIEKGGSSQS